MNVFIALKGTHFLFVFTGLSLGGDLGGGRDVPTLAHFSLFLVEGEVEM